MIPKWEALRCKTSISHYNCCKIRGFRVSRKGIENERDALQPRADLKSGGAAGVEENTPDIYLELPLLAVARVHERFDARSHFYPMASGSPYYIGVHRIARSQTSHRVFTATVDLQISSFAEVVLKISPKVSAPPLLHLLLKSNTEHRFILKI